MTLSKSYYADLALKIVPPSHHRPVGQLRTMIAEVLEREVNTALAKQREQEFPDLVVSRKELANQRQELLDHQETMKRKHKEKEAELQVWENNLNQREAQIQEASQRLEKLTLAIDAYAAWLDGDGEVDENARRFTALWEAYQNYKGKGVKQ